MSAKNLKEPSPAIEPAPPSSPATPASQPSVLFPPSEELGAQIRQFHEAQARIDRARLEELARLREIQNRD